MNKNEKRIRMLRAILKMVEGCLNRATDADSHERWKQQHQSLVTRITRLKKAEPELS